MEVESMEVEPGQDCDSDEPPPLSPIQHPTPFDQLIARPLRLMSGEIEHLWLCQQWTTHCCCAAINAYDIDVAGQVMVFLLLLHTRGFNPFRCMRPQWIDWISQNPVMQLGGDHNVSSDRLLLYIDFVGRTAVIVSVIQQVDHHQPHNNRYVLFGVGRVPGTILAVPCAAVESIICHAEASKCTTVDIVMDFSSHYLRNDVRQRLASASCRLTGIAMRVFTVDKTLTSPYVFRAEHLCDIVYSNQLQYACPLYEDMDSPTTIENMAIDMKDISWLDSHAALSYPGYRAREKTKVELEECVKPLTKSQEEDFYARQYVIHALTVLLYPIVWKEYPDPA